MTVGAFSSEQFSLGAYDAKGAQRGDPKAMPGVVWGVDLTLDDRVLVAAVADGTIRWYSAANLTELLALFVDKRDKRWVAWTPSGYYMASAGGEDLIGWHINRGWTQEAEFYAASQFHDRFYRPDIVLAILTTLDEDEAVTWADAERAKQIAAAAPAPTPSKPAESKPVKPEALTAALPPQATIVSPEDGARFSGDSIDVDFRLHASPGGTIDSLLVELDGRKFVTEKHLSLTDGSEGTITISPPKHDIAISLTPSAGALVGAPAKIKMVYAGETPPASAKPNLFVLAIGVDTYQNTNEFPRTYAKADVDGLIETLKQQEGVFFEHVYPTTLLDDDATIAKLRDSFDDIANKSTDNDYVLVYLAGHGFVGADGNFHFMMRNASLGRLNGTSLSERDLTEPLAGVSGKKILMFESCHAGAAAAKDSDNSNFNMGDVANTLTRHAALTFLGAAEGYQLAHFDAKWNYRGAFTQALMEGLSGASADKDGYITIQSLADYLKDRVGALTDHKQSRTFLQADPSNYRLAAARK